MLNSNIIFSWIKKEKFLKLSNPTGWYVRGQKISNSQILKWLKRNFKLGALSLFAPNNVTLKYYHISFLDYLWRLNLTMFKRKKKIRLHEFNDLDPSKSKRFVWFLNTLICQNGYSKDLLLFIKIKKNKKNLKRRRRKRNLIDTKKKNHSFSKSSFSKLCLDLILYERVM